MFTFAHDFRRKYGAKNNKIQIKIQKLFIKSINFDEKSKIEKL